MENRVFVERGGLLSLSGSGGSYRDSNAGRPVSNSLYEYVHYSLICY
jgi:hypothetical protein